MKQYEVPIPECRHCGEQTCSSHESSFYGNVHKYGPTKHKFTPKRRKDLRKYKIFGRAFLAHPECADGFKEDRKHGAIYGPTLLKFADGTSRFARDQEETSILTETCAYCGA